METDNKTMQSRPSIAWDFTEGEIAQATELLKEHLSVFGEPTISVENIEGTEYSSKYPCLSSKVRATVPAGVCAPFRNKRGDRVSEVGNVELLIEKSKPREGITMPFAMWLKAEGKAIPYRHRESEGIGGFCHLCFGYSVGELDLHGGVTQLKGSVLMPM